MSKPSKKFYLIVTEEDNKKALHNIFSSFFLRGSHCPTAQAFKRKFKINNVIIKLWNSRCGNESFRLSENLERAIRDWDSKKKPILGRFLITKVN